MGPTGSDRRGAHAADPRGDGLLATGVGKRFGSVIANDRVDLAVRPGAVHALLGENGAGKSTLVSMLDGRVEPDDGTVLLDGQPVTELAQRRRIATVHQTLALVPSMTGLENIALGLGRAADPRLRTEIAAVEERFSLSGELQRPVAELELPQRQRIALLEALSQEPEILILDEPTTFLPPTDVAPFLARIKALAEAGVGVLLITHHLEEARQVADELTVLRHGRVVSRFDAGGLPDNATLARAVVGETLVEPSRQHDPSAESVVTARGLTVTRGATTVLAGVDLDLRRGEIVGVAGVDGNGQLELLEALAGLHGAASGAVELEGRDVSALGFRQRARLGLQFVSGERLRDGIVPTFTVAEHFAIYPGTGSELDVESVLARYDVRPRRAEMRADRLSGGNQQKMIMGRALERAPKALVLAYPTQGLDVLATSQIHRYLLEQADSGVSVLVASSDLDELLAIADRILVMTRGAVAGSQEAPGYDRDQLGSWFTGGRREAVG